MFSTQQKIHSFEPIADENSRLLILGTMPSVASLNASMYYSHPRNAFYKILSELTGDDPGNDNASKKAFLLRHGIAVFDTLALCEREGSLDSNIKSPVPNDIKSFVAAHPKIEIIFLNGGGAAKYYKRYHQKAIELPAVVLPSTSPANARGGYQKKLEAWQVVADFLL